MQSRERQEWVGNSLITSHQKKWLTLTIVWATAYPADLMLFAYQTLLTYATMYSI
jgi:hypothetical protein